MAIEKHSSKATANAVASSMNNPAALFEWMRGLVVEWCERDGKVYSVATMGDDLLRGDGTSVSPNVIGADLFAVVKDQVESTFYKTELLAGLERLAELLGHKARNG